MKNFFLFSISHKQKASVLVYTVYMIAIILFQVNRMPILCENHRYREDGKSQRILIVFLYVVRYEKVERSSVVFFSTLKQSLHVCR